MDLPNKYFEDFPIEFKEIKKRDLSVKIDSNIGTKNPNGFTVKKKVHDISRNRYLNDDLQGEINLTDKETVVINAPVGNGKSYAIIQTIKRFYEDKDQDYLIVVASPFVSLVEQYVADIHKDGKIPKEQIYNYDELGRTKTSYINRKVQVVTANTLLGNPGEDSYKNSDYKRNYLNNLIKNCEQNQRKVIFIFDEIHDTIQNFKEEYIFNLWKWKNVLHKNFVISATFTLASFIVIEYLAELTDKKITIFEFPRIRIRENQSKLFLHYSPTYKFSSQTPEIASVILNLINRDKRIDILCYSKSLSKAIISDKLIGKKLKEKFGEINDCTSENISNERPENAPAKNRFDNNKCNVGTNFKSGVSIQKENHAFVIILPSRHTQGKFKNNYGIFSSGISSIIQALARQRKKGEIHIILSRPDDFDYSSLKDMNYQQRKAFKEFYSKIKDYSFLQEDEKVKYIPLSYQGLLVKNFYKEELKKNVQKGIDILSKQDRSDLARLDYPPYKNFQLNESENYLSSYYKFFGGDLSAYVTYCAFTNQFTNCYLEGIEYKSSISLEIGVIQKSLNSIVNLFIGEDYFNSLFAFNNFRMAYEQFRNKLLNEFIITIKSKKPEKSDEQRVLTKVSPYRNSMFEQQLLRFIAHKYYGKSYYYGHDYKNSNKDLEYPRSKYFIDSIQSSRGIIVNDNTEYSIKVKAFQTLDYFREKLVSEIRTHSRGNNSFDFLTIKPIHNFIETSDLTKFQELITYFTTVDCFTSNDVFPLKKRLSGNFEKQKQSFYKLLIEDFFNFIPRKTIPRVMIDGVKESVYPDIKPKEIPNSRNIINLIQKQDYIFPENFLDSKTIDENFKITKLEK